MMTVKQVSALTGVSVRTLQFYDEIDLLKPTQTTSAGYRLYDEHALETLQQILFFKELDFTLKEIKAIMANPHFNKTQAFAQQRTLIQLKRDHLDALLGLLDKLIKGEQTMDFKEFDMSTYFEALNAFKETHTQDIIRQMGSIDNFEQLLTELHAQEEQIAEIALRTHGSLEDFTQAMQKNMTRFLTEGPAISPDDAHLLSQITQMLTEKLTADLDRDVASAEVQAEVAKLLAFVNITNRGLEGSTLGKPYWSFMADSYLSNPAFIQATDTQYGSGASHFIGEAIQVYLINQPSI